MITPKTVRRVVESEFHLDLSERNRSAPNIIAAKIYSMAARRFTIHSLPNIAKEVNRDHATIIHHLKDADVFERNFPEAREALERINDMLAQMSVPNIERPAMLILEEMENLVR